MKIVFWAITFLFLISSIYAVPLVDNTGAYFKLDGDFIDATPHGYDGTNVGTTNTTGKFNPGRDCDGSSQYFSIPKEALNGTVFSVNMWVNPDTLPATDISLFGTYDSTPNSIVQLQTNGQTLKYYIRGDSGTGQANTTTNVLSTGSYQMATFVVDDTSVKLYVDKVLKLNDGKTWSGTIDFNNDIYVCARNPNGGAANQFYNGKIDEFAIYPIALNTSDIDELYLYQYPNYTSTPVLSNFTISATDIESLESLNINATILYNGTTYSFNGTNINTGLSDNTLLANITIFKDGYYNRSFLNYNISTNLETTLLKWYKINITYNNYIDVSGYNITRNLTSNIIYRCPSFYQTNLTRYIDDTGYNYGNIVCDGTNKTLQKYYKNPTEGAFNISFGLDTINKSYNINTTQSKFISDLYNPVISLNTIDVSEGFLNSVEIQVKCYDNIFPNVFYNITYNQNSLISQNLTNNTQYNNTNTTVNGVNELYTICSDGFGETISNYTNSVYFKILSLVDELDNTVFNLDNCTGARLYFDDNSSYFDFKVSGNTSTNFTSIGNNKLRLDLEYLNSEHIIRYIDVSLPVEDNIRLCANKQGVVHYEQLIIASTQKATLLKNVFSQCYIAADYTRFAYQDAFMLKAYTVNSMYYLYTFDAGEQVFLASVDGTEQSYINIDILRFSQTSYDIAVLGDSLSVDPYSATSVRLYYQNIAEDNIGLNLLIYRQDTEDLVFNTSSFTNNNFFTVYFDYSTLMGITNNTIFKAVVTKEKESGIDQQLTKYFNLNADSGILNSKFAFVFATILIFFGLTLITAKDTLGWFGIFIELAALVLLTLAIQEWYILIMEAGIVILLVFTILVMVKKNYAQVA